MPQSPKEKAMFANLKSQDFKTLTIRLLDKEIDPELKVKINQEIKTREIKERKELGLKSTEPVPILQEERLEDILQEVGNSDTGEIDDTKIEKVVKENIQEILKREKFLPEGSTVDITQVDVREETGQIEFKKTGEGESGFYQYDFTIRKDGKQIGFGGTAYGSISLGDITDMELDLFREKS
jgi:hypothetical protein